MQPTDAQYSFFYSYSFGMTPFDVNVLSSLICVIYTLSNWLKGCATEVLLYKNLISDKAVELDSPIGMFIAQQTNEWTQMNNQHRVEEIPIQN